MLQERLAAAVRREQRGREQAAEGAHGKYQPAALPRHAGRHERSDAQRGEAVDCDDVPHLGVSRLDEGNGDVVGFADVIDKDGDITASRFNSLLELRVIEIAVSGKVHGEDVGFNTWVLGGDILLQSLEFRLCAGDEEEVEFLAGKLEGEFFA